MGNREDYPRLRLFARTLLYLGAGMAFSACAWLEKPPSEGTEPAATPDAVSAGTPARPLVTTFRSAPSIFPVLTLGTDAGELKRSLQKVVGRTGAADEDSLWPHLSRGFALDHHLNQRAVQEAVRRYTENPEWMAAVRDRMSLYLPYFLEEVQRRNLPAELALLPIIESTLDPEALSPRGALGLWQFMPDTANRFGLSRDWWHDSRMDTVASTRAALDYLELLHAQFGDWLLTMAAYNAGEGTVARSLPSSRHSTSGDTRFFKMNGLPAETRSYVPRVLALAAIIKDPERYDVELPSVGRDVRFEAIRTDKPVDLNLAASILNVPPSELVALNPGFHRQATPPDGTHNLLVPTRIADYAQARINAMAENGTLAPVVEYRVQRGDSLSRIARTFNSTVAAIKSLNGMRTDRIAANAILRIPRAGTSGLPPQMVASASPSRPQTSTYRVRRGDSLGTIARRHDVSVKALMAANQLRSHRIKTNEVLRIPVAVGSQPAVAGRGTPQPAGSQLAAFHPPAAPAARSSSPLNWAGTSTGAVKATTSYRIRAGDSLSTIASRHGITTSQLRSMNGLRSDRIRANQTLRVPATGPTPAAAVEIATNDTYRIRAGDTLWSIARRHAVSRQELMRINGLQSSSVLKVGRDLKIPQPAPVDVAGG